LVPASGIRAAVDENVAVGSSERDVVDGRHGPPDVHEGFGRGLIRGGVDEPDIRRERQSDSD